MLATHQFFSKFHPERYESFDTYQPTDEFLQIVRTLLPPTWCLRRGNKWFYTEPPDEHLPTQGWKIHVSAIPNNSEEILRKTAATCIHKRIAFKFSLDPTILSLSIDKIWPREASGKFITIYPHHEQEFRQVIEVLYTSLQGFIGPYILSDKRYKDSQVVYYRYGGIKDITILSPSGELQHVLQAPDGNLVPDIRAPYWSPPSWVSDPFDTEEEEDDGDPTLHNGRYIVRETLNYSVSGGVYLATDTVTEKDVIIKEARPATVVDSNGHDAFDRLQKEYRLLQKLQGLGITPDPVELFHDWEHLFLVEEYIEGTRLGRFITSSHPLFLKTDHNALATRTYLEQLRAMWVNIARGVEIMHEKGIVYGDLSVNNILVENAEAGKIRFIDLESSWEEGIDTPSPIGTPGFTSPTRKKEPSKKDDFYALGAIMLAMLYPITNLLDLDPSKKGIFLREIAGILGLPEQLRDTIEQCLSYDASQRPTPQQVVEVILNTPVQDIKTLRHETPSKHDLLAIVQSIANHIVASADVRRKDCLFPADPMVFLTNPLSVAYGATGVLYALSKMGQAIPQPLMGWLLSQPLHPEHYPPHLYIGSAGIAWALWEMGLQDMAIHLFETASHHSLLRERADVFYGASGYGLACLHFYLRTSNEKWLDQAVQIGDWLLQTRVEKEDSQGYCWPNKEGEAWLGYALGTSGIALYLLYLSLATGEKRFLHAGEQAMTFDLAHLRRTGEGYLSTPRGPTIAFENVLTQYWLDGSAGVATALMRFWAATKNPKYFETLTHLLPDVSRKYTSFPGLFRGLSGLGHVLLDAYTFTEDPQYLQEAYRTASGILPYQLHRPDGIAFPGEQLLRISTDFGTGSAGIALFLYRLAHTNEGQRAENTNFLLDQYLLS